MEITRKAKTTFKKGCRIILVKHDEFSKGQGLKIGGVYTVREICKKGDSWVSLVNPKNCYYPGHFVHASKKAAAKAKAAEAKEQKAEAARKAKEAARKAKEAKIISSVTAGTVKFSPAMDELIREFGCHEERYRALMTRVFLELTAK